MRLRTLLVGLLTALIAALAMGAAPAQAAAPETARHGWRVQMLIAANQLRAQAGIPPLRLCPRLTRTAQDYAEVMATSGSYGHRGPDGTQPWDRMRAHGYAWRNAAENIGAGYHSVGEVMLGWRDSPEHRVNLLNPHYSHVGFGRASAAGSKYGTYWVQDFGSGGSCGR